MLTLPVFGPFLLRTFCPFPLLPWKWTHRHNRHKFCMVCNNSWHERGYNSHEIGEAVMKIGGLEVAISQSMSA